MESIKSSTELPRHTITLQRLGIGGLWAVIVLGRKFAFLAHVEASTRGADSIRARAESQIREGMSPAAHLNSIRSAWRALARGRTFFSAVSARKNWTVLSDNRRGKSRWIRSGETSTRARRPPKGYLGQQVQAIIGKVDGRATLLIFADQNSTIHWNYLWSVVSSFTILNFVIWTIFWTAGIFNFRWTWSKIFLARTSVWKRLKRKFCTGMIIFFYSSINNFNVLCERWVNGCRRQRALHSLQRNDC